MLLEHRRGELRDTLHQLDGRRALQLGTLVTEAVQSRETRVGLTEDSVTVARHDTATLERSPESVRDLLVRWRVTHLTLDLKDPVKHFLVGKTVQGASQTVQRGGVGQVRVREGTADQVARVSRHVTTLVVTVHRQVETKVVRQTLLVAVAEHVREVLGKVHAGINVLLTITLAEHVEVDTGGNSRETSNEVKRVLEGRLPELSLLDTGVVSGSKLAVVVQRRHSRRELRHGVKRLGERVNRLLHEAWELGAGHEVLREALGLLGRRHLAGQQKPEHRLGQHLLTRAADVLGSGQLLLALRDALTVEGDTTFGVKDRALPEHALEATHTTDQVANVALAERSLGVLRLDASHLLTLGRYNFADSLSKRLRRRVAHRRSGRGKLAGSRRRPESSTRDSEGQHLEVMYEWEKDQRAVDRLARLISNAARPPGPCVRTFIRPNRASPLSASTSPPVGTAWSHAPRIGFLATWLCSHVQGA